MDELLVWLRGVIEGDKAKAVAAQGREWAVKPVVYGAPEDGWGAPSDWEIEDSHGENVVSHHMYEGGGIDEEVHAVHIALHDPRDTTARCEGELALLDEHVHVPADECLDADFGCETCHSGPNGTGGFGWCETVRSLAYGYRHRPGWKQEWKPE